jgi:hypothetical protein
MPAANCREATLCERIKRLGYVQDTQVKLYGEIFTVISDPIVSGNNLVFIDAIERRTGNLRRIRIPLPIVLLAQEKAESR